MSWHYWSSGWIYTGVGLVTAPLMLRYRLTPYHLIYANPGLPFGGMEIGSKSAVLERLRGRAVFLEHLLLEHRAGVEENLRRFESFLEATGVGYPVIAKPDLGCVGFGVRKVHGARELAEILSVSPVDYLVQEYCPFPLEFSVFFVRPPGSRSGLVPSLTEKEIPRVTGDGRSSVGQLIEREPRFSQNRKALKARVKGLDRVPEAGRTVELLVQASHTYGTFFYDRCERIDDALCAWVNRLCADIPSFRFVRFDLKAEARESLSTGQGVKIMEVNGCMSEPIHMYDPRHGLGFGMKTFYRFYAMAFRIARSNLSNGGRPPYGLMNRAFLRFFRDKKTVMREIG